jgi:hypothetical protein
MSLNKTNLIAGYNYTKGNVLDISSNSNDGSLLGADVFVHGKNGLNATGDNGGYINVSNDASLALDACTLVVSGDFTGGFQGTEYFMYRYSGGNGFIFYGSSS